MNRFSEIDNLLIRFKEIIKNNPNIKITNKLFYVELETYGISKENLMEQNYTQENSYVKGLFSKWEKDFEKSKCLGVYEDDRQTRFIQFRNTEGIVREEDYYEDYKLYISVKKEALDETVNDIFKYIDSQKMITKSKVADALRSDSIVIRLPSQKDAINVINYINSNQFIINNALPTNPFVPRHGVVGYSYDERMSYNCTVANLLKRYFILKKNTNNIDSVNLADFKDYINNLLTHDFADKNSLVNIMNDEYFINERQRLNKISKEELVLNVKKIVSLINDSLDSSKNIQDYLQKVETFKGKEYSQEGTNKISELLNTNLDNSPDEIIKNYIMLAIKKYGINRVPEYLRAYLNGSEVAITRENNFRNLFSTKVSRSYLASVLGDNIDEYSYNVADTSGEKEVFMTCVNSTLNKYGVEQLRVALQSGLMGNFNYFTNDNNARENLIARVDPHLFEVFANASLNEINERLEAKTNATKM